MAKQKIVVNPNEPNPTHHVQLTGPDGRTIGLILTDGRGNVDPEGMSSVPYPRSAIKTFSGGSSLDTEEPPYNPITQSNWSGGMGKQIFDEDSTRFTESHWVDPSQEGKLMLAPYPEYQQLEISGNHGTTLGSTNFYFDPTNPYIAVRFKPTWTGALKYISFWGLVEGTLDEAGDGLTGYLYSDAAGLPNAQLDTTGTLTAADIAAYNLHHHGGMITLNLAATTGYSVTAGTWYWFVLYLGTNTDQENCFKIAVCNDGSLAGARNTTLPGVWSAGNYAPYFHYSNSGSSAGKKFKFHQYNGATYGVLTYMDMTTNSSIVMNGDRGCCDSNAGQTTKIIDATKAWVVDMWAGASVAISRGTWDAQSNFLTWRKIISNTATELVLERAIDTTVTTDEYIIYDTPIWTTVVADVGFPAYDSVVFDGQIVLSNMSGNATNGFVAYQRQNTGIYYQRMGAKNAIYTTTQSEMLMAIEADDRVENRNGEMLIGGVSQMLSGQSGHLSIADPVEAWLLMLQQDGLGTTTPIATAHIKEQHLVYPWNVRVPSELNVANVTPAISNGMQKAGIAAGFTTGNLFSDAVTAKDLTGANPGTIIASLFTNVTLPGAGDIQLGYSDTAALGGTPVWYSFAAQTANRWAQNTFAMTPTIAPAPNESKIISIGLRRQTNLGAQNVFLYAVCFTSDTPNWVSTRTFGRINGWTTYSGSLDGSQRKSAWMFTEDGGIYEYQQSARKLVQLIHPGINAFGGPYFGKTATQHGLYLYFGVNKKLSRYYNNQIDDVGPDKDDGFETSHRDAIPFEMKSYPGMLFVNYLHRKTSGFITWSTQKDLHSSFIMAKPDGGGWYEFAHQTLTPVALPARSLGTLRGLRHPDKLLWNEAGGDKLCAMPISSKPLQEEESGVYNYMPRGSITTSKYYANRRDITKFWKSLKITADNLSDGVSTADKVGVLVEYRTDENPSWTHMVNPFDQTPFQTQDFSPANDVTGRWIQLRLTLYTSNKAITPVIWGIVIDSMIRVPTKDAFNLTFRLANQDLDLRGGVEEHSAKQKHTVLKEWIASATPVVMSTLDEITHGTTVYPEPVPLKRTRRQYDDKGTVRTAWVCQMTVLEI